MAFCRHVSLFLFCEIYLVKEGKEAIFLSAMAVVASRNGEDVICRGRALFVIGTKVPARPSVLCTRYPTTLSTTRFFIAQTKVTMPSSSPSSQIKGGGKALLTRECRQSMISLLMRLADNDENNKDMHASSSKSSKHEQERRGKIFVKQLVQRYERKQLQQKYNSSSNVESSTTAVKNISSQAKTAATVSKAKTASALGNVRLEIAEANFKSGGDNSKKKADSNSKKKGKSRLPVQTGAKKVLVLPRSTTVDELCRQAKTKLRIKKSVSRAFVLEKSSSNAMIDLEHDLSGVEDGTTIYVTSSSSSSSAGPTNEKAKDQPRAAEQPSTTTTALEEDPLEQVKRAYAQQERQRRRYQTNILKSSSNEAVTTLRIDAEKARQMTETTRMALPAWKCKNDILAACHEHSVVVLSGATGSGKSTQVPQFLWEQLQMNTELQQTTNEQGQRYIVVTQPRRVAAISLAQRVAEETGSPAPGMPGSLVGYMVRLDRKVADATCRIIYCTVGVLLRMLVCPKDDDRHDNDDDGNSIIPALSIDTISHLILDEVHERDVNTDFSLTLLRGLLASKQHPQLRLILMSATASANFFVDYFASVTSVPPMSLEIPGRTFPVQVNWISDCEHFAGTTLVEKRDTEKNGRGPPNRHNSANQVGPQLSPRAYQKIDNNLIRSLIVKIVQKQQSDGELKVSPASSKSRSTGAILVFLPGKAEIEALARCLYEDKQLTGDRNICNILKLYSSMPRSEQQTVFQPAASGSVKIVLATNVAE